MDFYGKCLLLAFAMFGLVALIFIYSYGGILWVIGALVISTVAAFSAEKLRTRLKTERLNSN